MTCKGVQSIVRLAKIKSISRKTLASIIGKICTDLKIESEKVCTGIGRLFAPPIKFILQNTRLSNKEIAGLVVGHKCLKRGEIEKSRAFTWKTQLPPHPAQLVAPSDAAPSGQESVARTSTGPSDSSFKFVHLTDLHLDLEYSAGSSSLCTEPVCCRADSTPSKGQDTIERAGHWGDVNGQCDAPYNLINESLAHISQTIRADNESIKYVIYSGNCLLLSLSRHHNRVTTASLGLLSLLAHLFALSLSFL